MQYETALARQPAGTGIVGIDRGVAVTLATSDGRAFTTPGLPPGQQARMLRLQRALSRRRRLNPCQGDRWVTINDRSAIRRGAPARDRTRPDGTRQDPAGASVRNR